MKYLPTWLARIILQARKRKLVRQRDKALQALEKASKELILMRNSLLLLGSHTQSTIHEHPIYYKLCQEVEHRELDVSDIERKIFKVWGRLDQL